MKRGHPQALDSLHFMLDAEGAEFRRKEEIDNGRETAHSQSFEVLEPGTGPA